MEAFTLDPSLKNVVYYQYHTYNPYNATFKNNDEIRLPINSQDLYTVPGDSKIYVEGTIDVTLKTGSTAADFQYEMTNNALLYLFEQIKYEINGEEVDRARSVGVTSTCKTLLTSSPQELNALQIAGWGTPIRCGSDNTFYGMIPLSMVLGFNPDVKTPLVRLRQELILIRSRTDKNCYLIKPGCKDKGSISISLQKVQWIMPQVKFNLATEKTLLDKVKNNVSLLLPITSFETFIYPQLPTSDKDTWKLMTTTNVEAPSYIILVFQTNRSDSEESDASKFDHVNLRSFKVYLNSVCLPYEALNENFEKEKYLSFYQNYLNFITDFSNGEKLCEPALTMTQFKSQNPMFIMKCIYEDIIKPGPLDIQIEVESLKNFPAGTTVYAILIHKSVYAYQTLSGNIKRIL
ncbi:uncharacterized protein [Bemisia tabaci]|uniref:uncharacterized protein n=1 Tax=Bemisia tabaci TaxID=7038 RepID=UPI003B28877F